MTQYNNISDDKVKAATGRDWQDWISFLDNHGVAELDHKGIVQLVRDDIHKSWWSQMVTVGYEQAKGRRVKNQNASGFQINASKTVDAPLAKVYQAWDQHLSDWYHGPEFTITTNNENKNIRGKFADGSVFAMGLYETPAGKTQVALDQNKLVDQTAAEAARKSWKQALESLVEFLT